MGCALDRLSVFQAVVLYNPHDLLPAIANVTWSELGWTAPALTVKVRDLWRKADIGVFTDGFRPHSSIKPHDVLFLRMSPTRSQN